MSTADNDNNNKDDIPNICANCGKVEEGSNSLKACTACKMVKYCNRECQIAHRPQHKKECKKRAAELHDELLFKQPPPIDDCPICMLRLPMLRTGSTYFACCGKVICSGCVCSPVYDHQGNVVADEKCPFCRTPCPKTDEEIVKRNEKRVEAGDAEAIFSLGQFYDQGLYGLPQDYEKALELYHKGAELANAQAYSNIGNCYDIGRGVEVNKKKARHYWELAAVGGNTIARYNIGLMENRAGNMDRALKHHMIAVRDGEPDSLELIRKMITIGHATKDDYTKALTYYQEYLDEIKSDQRDKAAALHDQYKYIE